MNHSNEDQLLDLADWIRRSTTPQMAGARFRSASYRSTSPENLEQLRAAERSALALIRESRIRTAADLGGER